MRKAATIARILLGLVFTVFGLNMFLGFMPPPELNQEAAAFIGALNESGYVMWLVRIVEVVGGLMLLTGRFVPLGLVLLAPVVVNIVGIHVVLDRSGLPLAIAVLALEVFLAWAYRDSFRSLLTRRAAPHGR